IDQIAERTDGVPLFVEELTKSVLESGVTPVGIPTTLHDSLMARLDRLGSVRRVAQIDAAIGREVFFFPLHAVSPLPEDELVSESRFEAVRPARLTSFIGRENEINLLLELQDRAWTGDGQVVLVSGEPGIGKSRIAATFRERIADTAHTRL